MSLQQYTNWSRPAQPSPLANLPAEVLMEISELIGNPDGQQAAETLHNLSQLSGRLYAIVRPYFYRANNYRQFYHAVRLADIPMMNHCENYLAAPIDIMWRCAPGQHATALSNLLTGLEDDWGQSDDAPQASIHDKKLDNRFDALKWLLERGANGGDTVCHDRRMCQEHACDSVKRLGHTNAILLNHLQRGSSKHTMEVIVNMIKMLSSHGCLNPTRPDTFAGRRLPYIGHWQISSNMRAYHVESPLQLALKSHVVPSVLELMLSEYADQGIKLRDWYSACPRSLAKLARRERYRGSSTKWCKFTYINDFIWILHSDLHGEYTQWEEGYFGEVADIFQAKLKLMIKYEMVNAQEEALLKSIESALYSITADCIQASCKDEEQSKRSWEKLCDAIKPFANDGNLSVRRSIWTPNPTGPGRIHKFVIDSMWNP
ncbi:hypothetical protein FPSE_09994 [Fusarium pseudograminearum CS3096]|uniref:F-box domain-containing protein n=2 Tax=Fusarium pseudograminearum TaxID=101028 RepID=K3VY08_FUSPC|nr:hypothetical protein FPSE_09994 [Fusarium pseudograminearum CS3096]EKJ69825.1 hypothetical protein FPSE_09994 [Fusarium pseudograminearum CS3096]KAF0640931.1 hypothetical protein FPSE5266_09994 [Fusarium pseudograminearum]CEG02663.1 unnamed protein product [Fusarium pseudograminearum CS3487]